MQKQRALNALQSIEAGQASKWSILNGSDGIVAQVPAIIQMNITDEIKITSKQYKK